MISEDAIAAAAEKGVAFGELSVPLLLRTLVHCAAFGGHLRVVRWLHEAGFDATFADGDERVGARGAD